VWQDQDRMAEAKIILTAERGSGKFSDRVLILGEGEQVGVGRSTRELRPDTHNAVFDSRVLSRHQATFIYNQGVFLLRDCGSSNGSFINNFRLSKPAEQSLATEIYSKDIIRFGSQVNDKDKKIKEKCIVAKVQLFLPDGHGVQERPTSDRLFRPKEDMYQSKDKSPNKQVSFNQDNLIENKVNKLEKILNDRLGEKQSETEALEEKVRHSKESQDKMAAQLEDKKAEAERLADQLAVQAKEQMDSVKINDLQAELEDTKTALKRVTEEAWLTKERLRVELENGHKREHELTAANDLAFKETISVLQKEVDMTKLQVKQLNELVSEADEIVKDKERDIVALTDLVDRDKMIIKERDGEFQDLQCLMTEENETVHQIESEMRRLLNIIAEDQETILQKDKQVIGLQKALKAKDDFLQKEIEKVTEANGDIEKKLQQTVEEKNDEINEIEKEMQSIIDEKESEIFELKVALEEQKNSPTIKELEEAKYDIELLTSANEALKIKMGDLMKLVDKKNHELEEIKEDMKKHAEQKLVDMKIIKEQLTKDLDAREAGLQENIENIKLDMRAQEQLEAKNESLQKEILVMKVQSQQKDLDIKCLQEMADNKDETIRENSAKIYEHASEISRLKTELETNVESKDETVNGTDIVKERDEKIAELQQKVMNEQEANKQIEEELIHLKIEYDNLNQAQQEASQTKESLDDDEKNRLLKMKDQEIVSLQHAIRQEQEIVAHVQLTQEKEIIEKEREISVLNAILSEERQTILSREAEISGLLGRSHSKENGLSPAPTRPRRTKTLPGVSPPSRGGVLSPKVVRNDKENMASIFQPAATSPCQSPRLVSHHQNTLARMIQAASPTDDESTMTFHDALSDDEDVLIADLDMDTEEEEDTGHRKSDLVDLDPE